MMYADYKFYTENYGGKSVAEGDFPRLAAKASALIDRLTFLSRSFSPFFEYSAPNVLSQKTPFITDLCRLSGVRPRCGITE